MEKLVKVYREFLCFLGSLEKHASTYSFALQKRTYIVFSR